MQHCPEHEERTRQMTCLGQDMALLKKDMEYVRRDLELVVGRLSNHVIEAEKIGGRHERLAKVEHAVADIRINIERERESCEKERKTLELRMREDKVAIESQMKNDRIMGRWFMIGSGVISGVIVAGGMELIKTIVGILK